MLYSVHQAEVTIYDYFLIRESVFPSESKTRRLQTDANLKLGPLSVSSNAYHSKLLDVSYNIFFRVFFFYVIMPVKDTLDELGNNYL